MEVDATIQHERAVKFDFHTAPHWLICAQVKANSVFMEDEFAKLGAVFKKGDPWTSHVCKAGNLITAQNPQSADACAAAVIEALA